MRIGMSKVSGGASASENPGGHELAFMQQKEDWCGWSGASEKQ